MKLDSKAVMFCLTHAHTILKSKFDFRESQNYCGLLIRFEQSLPTATGVDHTFKVVSPPVSVI